MQIAPSFSGDRSRKSGSRLTLAVLGAVLTVGCLSGCSSLLAEHEHFVPGWRPGWIVEIEPGAVIQVRFALSCRQGVSADVAATTRYALVRYTKAPRRYGFLIAPLTPTPDLAIGDRVDVNIERCEVPMVKLPGKHA